MNILGLFLLIVVDGGQWEGYDCDAQFNIDPVSTGGVQGTCSEWVFIAEEDRTVVINNGGMLVNVNGLNENNCRLQNVQGTEENTSLEIWCDTEANK